MRPASMCFFQGRVEELCLCARTPSSSARVVSALDCARRAFLWRDVEVQVSLVLRYRAYLVSKRRSIRTDPQGQFRRYSRRASGALRAGTEKATVSGPLFELRSHYLVVRWGASLISVVRGPSAAISNKQGRFAPPHRRPEGCACRSIFAGALEARLAVAVNWNGLHRESHTTLEVGGSRQGPCCPHCRIRQ